MYRGLWSRLSAFYCYKNNITIQTKKQTNILLALLLCCICPLYLHCAIVCIFLCFIILFYYPYFFLMMKVNIFLVTVIILGICPIKLELNAFLFGLPLTLACVDKTDINPIEKCIRVYINHVYYVLYLSYKT